MNMEKTNTINFIFYLQTKTELDNTFLNLSDILSKLSISLLPIRVEELNSLDKTHKNHLVILRNDLNSGFLFNDLRKKFLDMAMLSGRIAIYDISSFSEIENQQKLEGKDVYRFIPLPADMKNVAMKIAVDYFKEKNNRDEWPGGKRAKLPSMNSSN